MYTKFAMSLIDGKDKFEAYKDMQKSNYDMFMLPARLQYSDILTTDISILPRQAVPSSGKTKESLIATLWSFLNSSDYSSAVLTAINLGGDTDTIGALTGGLAGNYQRRGRNGRISERSEPARNKAKRNPSKLQRSYQELHHSYKSLVRRVASGGKSSCFKLVPMAGENRSGSRASKKVRSGKGATN